MEEEDSEQEDKKDFWQKMEAIFAAILGTLAFLVMVFLLGFECGSVHFYKIKIETCIENPPPIKTKLGIAKIVLTRKWGAIKNADKDIIAYYCSRSPDSKLYALYQCNAANNIWAKLYETTCDCVEALPAVTGSLARIPPIISNMTIGSKVVYKCSHDINSHVRAIYYCNESSVWELRIDLNETCDCPNDPPSALDHQLRVWEGGNSQQFGTLVKYYCLKDEESAIEKVVRCEDNGEWKEIFQRFCGCKGLPKGIINSSLYELFGSLKLKIGEELLVYCDPRNHMSGIDMIIECNKTAHWSIKEEYHCDQIFRVIPKKLQYADAKLECWNLGGNLAVVKTNEEKEKLTTILDSYISTCQNFYLGIEEDLNRTWYSNGKPFKFDIESERKLTSDEKKCIILDTHSSEGKKFISNEDCSSLHCYICYFPSSARYPFQVVKKLVSFTEALVGCDIEGYLAELSALRYILNFMPISDEENEKCNNIYYLDGFNVERRWTTIDQEPLENNNLESHVISNFSDHCVITSEEHNLQWVPTDCNSLQCSICKIDKKVFWKDKPPSDEVELYKCPPPTELNLTKIRDELYIWPNQSQTNGTKITIYCFRDKADIYQQYECSKTGSWDLVINNICELSYQQFPHLKTETESAEICKTLNGTLAIAVGKIAFENLTVAISRHKKLQHFCPIGYTIGMFEDVDKQWELLSCPEMNRGYVKISRQLWASDDHPDSTNKKCLVINKNQYSKLTNEDCAERNCFICENYNLEYETRLKFLNYTDAIADCDKRQGRLATFRNKIEFYSLQTVVNKVSQTYCKKYFVGVRNVERSFYWLTKDVPASISGLVKKDSMDSFQSHCVSLRTKDFKLEDIKCEYFFNCFACSLPPNYFAERVVDFSSFMKCPKGFEIIGEKCYRFNTKPKLDSQTAQEQCLLSGGTLATIIDSSQLKRLQKTLPERASGSALWHIGLVVHDGEIEWRNGQLYNDYPEAEVDNDKLECGALYVDENDIVELHTEDFICTEVANYICEEDKHFLGFHEDLNEIFTHTVTLPESARSLTGCNEACRNYSFYTFNYGGNCMCGYGPKEVPFFYLNLEDILVEYHYFECSEFAVCKDSVKQICACDDKPALYYYGWPIYLGCFSLIENMNFTQSLKKRNLISETSSTHWCPISCWQIKFTFAVLDIDTNSCKCLHDAPAVRSGTEDDCRSYGSFVRLYRM